MLPLTNPGVPQDEIDAAVHPDAVDAMREEEAKRQNERKRSTRIMKLLKGTASGGIKTALGADKARAFAGGHHSKNRVGVVRKSAGADPKPAGPSAFPARYAGKRGRACLSQEGQGTAAPLGPVLSWTPSGKVDKEGDSGAVAPAAAAWAVSVDDIVEMKKVGGLGWKSKLAVGWAMGAEVVDGLVVTDRDGRVLHMTAVERRDELFNRLLATGDQVWESW